MKEKLPMIARYLLGGILVLFGLNKFLGFLPPPEFSAAAGEFMGALGGSGLMAFIGVVEIVAGILLLANRYVPLALTIFAPVAVNIIAFHLLLDMASIVPGLLVTALTIYLMMHHKTAFNGILSSVEADIKKVEETISS